jgi:ABC-type antimicrobial peptide transport system permease subunit
MYMVVVGIIIGIGAAISAGTLVSTVLFGLQPTDSITIVAAVATMLVVSSFAAYLPARRAARVDPMIALHYD